MALMFDAHEELSFCPEAHEDHRPNEKRRIFVSGAAGRMGSTFCLLLKREGHHLTACDWAKNERMAQDEFCDEYHVVDLRDMDNCLKVTRNVDQVFNFASSPGGLGFSESNPSVIEDDNATIGMNMVEAARINGVKRYFHASIAFCYPWSKLQCPNGFEKDETEMLCERYNKDFGLDYQIGRFYCIYCPPGTWEGGRAKAPAAFCREASASTDEFEMCGDGLQTHSFADILKYAKDVLKLMESSSREPTYIGSLDLRELVNIGSDEIVWKNETAEMDLSSEDNKLPIHHIPGQAGIGGRSSDNTPIEEKLGCVEVLKCWLRMTCFWIKEPIEKVKAQGTDWSTNESSEVVGTNTPVELGSLRTTDGKE